MDTQSDAGLSDVASGDQSGFNNTLASITTEIDAEGGMYMCMCMCMFVQAHLFFVFVFFVFPVLNR